MAEQPKVQEAVAALSPPQKMLEKHPSKPHLAICAAMQMHKGAFRWHASNHQLNFACYCCPSPTNHHLHPTPAIQFPQLPPVRLTPHNPSANTKSLLDTEEYQKLYKESITDPTTFWGRQARELLTWTRDFQTVYSGSLLTGDNKWFVEGELNASYNCVDRHAFKDPNRVAIIYEADEPENGRNVTYSELLRDVCKVAWTLKKMGAIVAILACIRIGAVHSVVFAGFSADSLRDRVLDADSRVVITSDEGKRGGKLIGTKKIVDEALKQCPAVRNVLVFRRTGTDVPMQAGRDVCPMNSEDPLFLLYTSGSTGKPKGVMHTTAGYLLGCAMTGKYVFDIHDGDRFFCGGDVGWITGHSYVVYAPLLLGVTTVVFEGTPAYPNFSRYWDIINKHQITQFYVAPTALRLLKRAGDEHVTGEMKHLRVLGSVGEPIAAEVWKWYYEVVGKHESQIVDVSNLEKLLPLSLPSFY
ncbi:hypothetical protein NQ176_g4617 [Zarea fungicola]|uniref:Uncharacterized protein n=1 Tax=Zarea fungicola TaxID=93591 RepID=A0ACC1NCF8_9HYPO|nr:hypothetical protein NQ176_g4617 [Lecanicillium fungicola]